MIFQQRFVPGLAIASYIVGDERTGEAVVIDPTRDVEPYIKFAKQNDLHIRHIIETHVHADFVCGSRELQARLEDRPLIYCSSYGGEDWEQTFADRHVKVGDQINVGKLRFEFCHVPGHTPEHIAITLFDESRSVNTPWLMFSGDFLFVGDVGRPDLLGEEAKQELAHQLYESVFDRIQSLPDITELFPAHGAGSLCGKAIGSRRSSTVGFERQFNDSLQQLPEQQWVQKLLDDMPLSPPYFKRMKQVNKQGAAIIGAELPGQNRLAAAKVNQQVCDDCLIVDVRAKESFAAAHIPGAINIPLGQNLPTWAGWVLPYDKPIITVLDNPSEISEVVVHLTRVGFDQIEGFLEGGMGSWETAGYELESLDTMSVHDLAQQTEDLTVLDVRTANEWRAGHIDGAIHIHGGTLQEEMDRVPSDKPVAVVCGSGYRASIASSFLKKSGWDRVSNVIGGMSAWQAAQLPVAK